MKYILLQDAVGKACSVNEKILYMLLAGFFISFFLPRAPALNYVFIILMVIFAFFYNPLDDKVQLVWERPAIIAMLLFFLLHFISAAVSSNRAEGVSMLFLRAPLILFPIAIGSVSISGELKNRIFFLFCFLTTAAALICILQTIFVYLKTGDVSLLYNDNLSRTIGMQSVYFALVVTLAVFAYVYLLLKVSYFRPYRVWIYLAIVFLFIIQFLLASRMEMGILYGTTVLFIAGYLVVRKRKIIHAIAMAVIMLALVLLCVRFFPKTLNRFNELQYKHYTFSNTGKESHFNMRLTPDQWNGVNSRLAIWKCGWELCKDNFFSGIPLGDKKEALMKIYTEKHFLFGLTTKKNMHNTYLDVLSTFGIAGLMLFLSAFIILPLRSCFIYKDWIGAVIIAAFAFSMLTETYPDRRLGCVLLAFFTSFVASYKGKYFSRY